MKRLMTLLLLILFVSGTAFAEMRNTTVSATPPSQYTDGSVIPAEKLPNMLFRCYRTDASGNVLQTLSQQQGTPSCGGNVDMTPGTTYWFTMDVVLDGMASDKAAPKSFVYTPGPSETMMALSPPQILTMGNDNVLRWSTPTTYADGTPVDVATLSNYRVYIFSKRPSDAAYQYIGETTSNYFQIPGQWWINNAALPTFPLPLPTPGSSYTFAVSARHFTSNGQEWVSQRSQPVTYTFQAPTPKPGVPVILDVVAQIEGVIYTVRLEGVAYPKEGN